MDPKLKPWEAARQAFGNTPISHMTGRLERKHWEALADAAIRAYIGNLERGVMVFNPNAGPLFPDSEDEGE